MQTYQWAMLSPVQQQKLLKRPALSADRDIEGQTKAIVDSIKIGGDKALWQAIKKFEKACPETLKVDKSIIQKAENAITDEAKAAIIKAYDNIRTYHSKQGYEPFEVSTMAGVTCQRIVRPLNRVGLYVPGGSAPLISTTLMLGVPAQLAGVTECFLASPPDQNGQIDPHILYAANLCGINSIYTMGGAHAIAAMAYGTETVPKVDKIFGPGNAYVTAAKSLVAQDGDGAALDMPAGPSEVCVIANDHTPVEFAASDLLSQAEHDPLSQVLLISTSEVIADKIIAETKRQLTKLTRASVAEAALENSVAIVANTMANALAISNQYGPEHLILCFEGAEHYLDSITNAGSIFVGPLTPESAGDYASGTNHVLPTYGYSRAYSGLSVEAFQKTISVQSINQQGLNGLGPSIITLAELEGLDAHANAVKIRLLLGDKT